MKPKLREMDELLQSHDEQLAERVYYITPEMYGAKGDGTADDTAAIQAAIDFARNKRIDIRFGTKVYRTTSPLTIYSNIRLIGTQVNMSTYTGAIIKNTVSDMLTMAQDVAGNGYNMNVNNYITGINFIGADGQSTTHNFISNTARTYLNWGVLKDCGICGFIKAFPYVAFTGYYVHSMMMYNCNTIGLIGGSDNSFYHWMINSVETNTNRQDYFIDFTSLMLTTIEDIYMTGALATGNGVKTLFRLQNVNACTFNHIVFDYCDYYAIYAYDNVYGNTFENCDFRGNARASDATYLIYLGTNVKHNKFLNNNFIKVHQGVEKLATTKIFYFSVSAIKNIVRGNYYDTEVGGLTYFGETTSSFFIDEESQNIFVMKDSSYKSAIFEALSNNAGALVVQFATYPNTVNANSTKTVSMSTGVVMPVGCLYKVIFDDSLPSGISVYHTTYDGTTLSVVFKNSTGSNITMNTNLNYHVVYFNLT